jgi:hypothetical protein
LICFRPDHYVAWLKGKQATMVELDGTDHGVTGHPLLMNAVAIDDPNPSSTIPTSQFFSEGNGGESRKSYHGYPQYKNIGNAQLLESPTEFVMTPMQSKSPTATRGISVRVTCHV